MEKAKRLRIDMEEVMKTIEKNCNSEDIIGFVLEVKDGKCVLYVEVYDFDVDALNKAKFFINKVKIGELEINDHSE